MSDYRAISELVPFLKPKKCEWLNCLMEFENDMECLNHVRKTHDVRKLGVCKWNNCAYKGSGSNNMGNHIKKHFDVVEGVCNICKVKFKWKFDLNKHLKTYHQDGFRIQPMHVGGYHLQVAVRSYDEPLSPVSPISIQSLLN